ncbi:MAG: fibronectin type III domain-containing protein, partial [Muribaculaceae bacterium]|nr:fibronectin type III domain-containing protein [Muribaculaceae bacterium]
MKTKTKRTAALLLMLLMLAPAAAWAQVTECRRPTELAASNIESNSAILSWVENGPATSWIVAYATSNDNNFTEVNAPTNPFTLTGLVPATQYIVKVLPVCEVDKWSDEITFTTPCGPIAITADSPYTQGFESPEGTAYDAQGPLPDCWDGPGDFAPHNTVFANSHGGSQSLSFYHPQTYVIGYVRYALLPEFSNPLYQLQVSFCLSAEKQKLGYAFGSIALGYITAEDDGTCNTFTAIETYEYALSSWEQRTTMLWLVPTAAQRLVFKAEGSNIIFYVDDLEVSVLSIDCYPVSNLGVDNVTTTSASLDWELLDDSQTEWNVQVATNADFTENLTHYVADIHENFALGNLSPSTRYYVRVRPSCNESLWSSTLDFLTLCGPITITADAPYFEDFQSYVASALPDCWEAYTTGATAPSVVSVAGSKYLRFTDNSFAILPEFSNPLSELQISFYMKNLSGQLQVGYITAEDDDTCNTFTAIATYDLASSWVQRITYMFDVPATAQRLVFKCDNVHGYCSIDNVEVAVVPLGFCYPVKALSLGEVFYSAAYLSWELVDESQTEWDVQVATNEDFTENVTNLVANSHENYLIDGLTGGTTYHVRVKPACSEDHWSDLKSFTTLCGYDITLETPYTEGFESPQGVGTINYGLDGPLPSCWEAHTTSETNALDPYIYNDPNIPVYHEGSQCLIFDYKDNSYAILPEFSNALNELQISFWMKIQTNSGSINIDQLS